MAQRDFLPAARSLKKIMTKSSKKIAKKIVKKNQSKPKKSPPPSEVPKQESLLSISSSGRPLPEHIDLEKLTFEQQFQLLNNPLIFDPGTVIKSSSDKD